MKYLFTCLFSLFLLNSFSQNNFWQKVSNKQIQINGVRKIIPQTASLVYLNDAAFKTFQQSIPDESTNTSAFMYLPTPDGNEILFRVFENTCMDKALAEKYPMIKTYHAIGVNNPTITAKLDYTAFGFHAMVFSEKGIYYIDPYSSSNTGYYNCYYKKDYTRSSTAYSVCEINETHISEQAALRIGQAPSNGIDNLVANGQRRTYRLALACTAEYSTAVCAPNPVTKANVLSAMVTTMNRVNGVYEKDLSIHMNLIPNNDTLIFIGTDSYSNDDGGAMLGQNQIVCNNRIGSANYDIGHVFSTGGGGVAYLGCVCVNADKAKGVTGSGTPYGDGFDIDYVAHEMGHQFGANHTFNGNTGACVGNGNSSTAYEPGSGTTIMGYAGICDANDIQPHSDDYFHRASIVEIYNHITSTSCAVITNTGNVAPNVASYKATYSIPYKTSFELTASATDPNGRPLNYLWEEWDLGPFGTWSNPNILTAPLFRSFSPNPSPTRVFPTRDSLIKNVIRYKGEVLPEVARDMKFRCTVTNIDPNGYGAFNAPDSNLTVKSVVTPSLFRVTSQATATSFAGNSTQTITWNVANTTTSPISCANINIYLSLDSAKTFPYLLASNTANDGSEIVTIPNVSTTAARIKVKGSGNIFFDLNDGWINITQNTAASFTVSNTEVCEGESVSFTNTSAGNPDSVRWTINGGSPFTSNSMSSVSSVFNNTGIYTVSLIAYKSGVASTPFTATITVNPIKTTNVSQTICEGESVTIGTQTFTTSGNHTVVLQTSLGCDSTVNLALTVNPIKTTNVSQTICEGESVTIGTQTFTTSGNHTVVLQTSLGCDSTVNLALTVNPIQTTNVSQTICEGESVTIGTQTFTTSGNHTVVLQTSLGCDSTVNLALTVNPIQTTNVSQTICEGESVTIGTQTFTTSGNHTLVLQTSLGCDSTVNLALTVNPIQTTNVSQTICEGESVTIGTQTFTTSGNHTVVLQTSLGCDSTVNLALTVNPIQTTNVSQTICEGESVTIGTQTFTTSGNHTVVLQTSLGCDSTVNLALTVNLIKTTNVSQTICEGESVTIGTQTFTTSGNHTVVLQTTLGCDSTVNLALTVNLKPTTPSITQSNDTLFSNVIIAGAVYQWYKESNLIATTATPYYEFTSNGIYTLKIVNLDCSSDISTSINASLPTAIKNNKIDIQFSIVPNPSNGLFDLIISALKSAKYNIVLYSITGQEINRDVVSIHAGNNTKSFYLNIEKGMYYMTIENEDGSTTQQLIIQ